MKAYDLESVPFPECASECEVLPVLGAGECESVCSWKFNPETGDPYEREEICA